MNRLPDEAPSDVLARLIARYELGVAQIKANPMPFLEDVAEENARLRAAIDEAAFHLSGASSFDVAKEAFPAKPPGIIETVTIRNRKAYEALVAALHPPRKLANA